MTANIDVLNSVRAKAAEWLSEVYDEHTRAEVKRLLEEEDPSQLIDSFYRDLEFGTGGLRGGGNQPDEYLHRWGCNPGIEQLP